MSFLTDEFSSESIINSIFKNKRTSAKYYGLEEEIVASLEPEEIEILEAPGIDATVPSAAGGEPEGGASASASGDEEKEEEEVKTENTEAELAEESATLLGQINYMDFAMQTYEEFIYPKEIEVATEEEKVGLMKKFWNWLKSIYEKISKFVVTLFTKIGVWLSGDFVKISKWAKKNGAEIDKAIATDVKLKIKMPDLGALKTATNRSDLTSTVSSIRDKLNNGKGSADESLTTKCNELSNKFNISKIKQEVFGKDSKASDVSISDFNSKINIKSTLTDSTSIKRDHAESSRFLKGLKDSIRKYDSYSKADYKAGDEGNSKENYANVRKMAIAGQRGTSALASMLYFSTSIEIWKAKTAYRFAVMGIKKAGGKK